jgi:competence protein ComEC
VAIGLVAAAVAFGLIAWRTASVAVLTHSRPLFNANVGGRLADIQRLPEEVRVVLEAVRLKGSGVPTVEMTPVRLRVSLSKGAPPLHVDRILVLANISPPSGDAGRLRFPGRRLPTPSHAYSMPSRDTTIGGFLGLLFAMPLIAICV